MRTIQPLTPEEINSLRTELPAWSIKGKKLVRDWQFKDFFEAFGFITQVALLAQSMDHHPEWKNCYSKVSIELTTHDLGGLSNKDIELAQGINLLKT